MFEVICIDHIGYHPHIKGDTTLPEPEIGEVCQVIDSKKYLGVLFYRLAGYGTHGYDSANYAPLNGPDESIRLEEWQKEQGQRMDANWDKICQRLDKDQPYGQ